MRLWSLHPQYLDAQGLVAVWREGLLAKKVLEGKTRGYRNHPQLVRFKAEPRYLEKINLYLHVVCDEADRRGYRFDRTKLQLRPMFRKKWAVTQGQLAYEWKHLLKKLFKRSRAVYSKVETCKKPLPHPIFRIVKGDIQEWEVVKPIS